MKGTIKESYGTQHLFLSVFLAQGVTAPSNKSSSHWQFPPSLEAKPTELPDPECSPSKRSSRSTCVYKWVDSFFPVMWGLLVHRWPYVLKCFLSGSLTYSCETRKQDGLPVALTSLWQLKSNKINSLLGRALWLGSKGHETPVLLPRH